MSVTITLISFATDASSKLHVLWHYCNALAVNCAHICILEEPDKVVLGGLLESENGRAVEAGILVNSLCYLFHEALKGYYSTLKEDEKKEYEQWFNEVKKGRIDGLVFNLPY